MPVSQDLPRPALFGAADRRHSPPGRRAIAFSELVWLAALLAALLLPSSVTAAPGDLLTSFGVQGIAYDTFGQGNTIKDAILHPILGIVLGAYVDQGAGLAQIRLARMDPDTGAVLGSETLSVSVDAQSELHIKDDGAGGLIVGATAIVDATNTDPLIFRVNSDLTINPSFGLRRISIDLAPAGFDVLEDIEQLSDGRIVALVSVPTTFDPEAGLVFLNANGSPDTSIANGNFPDGVQIVPFQVTGEIYPVALAVDSRDRLWVAAARFGPSIEKIAVARLLPNAAADTSYAGLGSALVDYRECVPCPSDGADPFDIEILGDRGFIAVEATDSVTFSRVIAVARLTEFGGVDGQFGGWRRVPFPSPASRSVGGTPVEAVRPDVEVDPRRRGVVVAAEVIELGGSSFIGVGRLRAADGELDSQFAGGGTVLHELAPGVGPGLVNLMVDGSLAAADFESTAWVATSDSSNLDAAVMAIEGWPGPFFADGFESGDLSGWSGVFP
ncbi:MAG: hypothetical protein AAGM22_32660 [Acidobacteriota bacterium]